MIKSVILTAAMGFSALMTPLYAQTSQSSEKAKVYFTCDISPESLVKVYKALGKEATGRIAVKSAPENLHSPISCDLN